MRPGSGAAPEAGPIVSAAGGPRSTIGRPSGGTRDPPTSGPNRTELRPAVTPGRSGAATRMPDDCTPRLAPPGRRAVCAGRAAPIPAAWGLWRAVREEIYRDHPQSPGRRHAGSAPTPGPPAPLRRPTTPRFAARGRRADEPAPPAAPLSRSAPGLALELPDEHRRRPVLHRLGEIPRRAVAGDERARSSGWPATPVESSCPFGTRRMATRRTARAATSSTRRRAPTSGAMWLPAA